MSLRHPVEGHSCARQQLNEVTHVRKPTIRRTMKFLYCMRTQHSSTHQNRKSTACVSVSTCSCMCTQRTHGLVIWGRHDW